MTVFHCSSVISSNGASLLQAGVVDQDVDRAEVARACASNIACDLVLLRDVGL